jgi:hypothetical protein
MSETVGLNREGAKDAKPDKRQFHPPMNMMEMIKAHNLLTEAAWLASCPS